MGMNLEPSGLGVLLKLHIELSSSSAHHLARQKVRLTS